MEVFLIISVIINLILIYLVYVTNKKNTVYERELERNYAAIELVLMTMQSLDVKQMFETDDEVGTVFAQLRDILYTLRPIVYGDIDESETETEDGFRKTNI